MPTISRLISDAPWNRLPLTAQCRCDASVPVLPARVSITSLPAGRPLNHILEPDPQVLAAWLTEHGVPAYRAGQIRRWLFERRADTFDDMTDLPKELRAALAADFAIWTTKIAKHHRAADGTEKLLLELHDGHRIECVLLRDGPRRTICISTQVGCAMGCVFCASGLDGVVRNLTTGEIVEQMLRLPACCRRTNGSATSS